jgi:hypothetical protein
VHWLQPSHQALARQQLLALAPLLLKLALLPLLLPLALLPLPLALLSVLLPLLLLPLQWRQMALLLLLLLLLPPEHHHQAPGAQHNRFMYSARQLRSVGDVARQLQPVRQAWHDQYCTALFEVPAAGPAFNARVAQSPLKTAV